ncbi:MAG: hypothetical protein LKI92_04645 [Schleiferilactobacillus harbinensis]|jgi:hypothetical protein|nr:hypothetical protein [Schleiferilactobacillus harbinensis]MCI1912509.1 hypothetical protein [Schleiferilactobacillus harbinensis]
MSGLGQWFLGRFWRQRTIWIVALLAILCVAGFGGYTWWQRENYRHQETAQLDKVAQTVAFDMMENVSERQFPPKVNDRLQELRRKMIIALSQKRQAVQKGQTKKYLAADITRWQLAGDYYRLDPVGLARYGPYTPTAARDQIAQDRELQRTHQTPEPITVSLALPVFPRRFLQFMVSPIMLFILGLVFNWAWLSDLAGPLPFAVLHARRRWQVLAITWLGAWCTALLFLVVAMSTAMVVSQVGGYYLADGRLQGGLRQWHQVFTLHQLTLQGIGATLLATGITTGLVVLLSMLIRRIPLFLLTLAIITGVLTFVPATFWNPFFSFQQFAGVQWTDIAVWQTGVGAAIITVILFVLCRWRIARFDMH